MTNMKKKEYDYGKCDICDTPMEEKNIKQWVGWIEERDPT